MYAVGMLAKYRDGILTEDYLHCSAGRNEVNHGVTLVGYGKVKPGERVRGKCKEYWIIRNSWGADWGENGTFRICMDSPGDHEKPFGMCLVNKYAVVPNLDGTIIEPPE